MSLITHYIEFLAIKRASFLNRNLTDKERLQKVRSYWKFIFLRNPLERLLSAFRDKLESPLNFSEIYCKMFEMMKRSIMEQYKPAELKRWLVSNGSYNLSIDFTTYMQWIVDTPSIQLNEHFSPMIVDSQPCRIRYNFYGNFKRISTEMKMVITKLGVPSEYYHDRSYYSNGLGTAPLMQKYYSTVSADIKVALFDKIYNELDFYYHLYPEDRKSHISLLGVDQLVL